jgi:hypothetical protein
VHGDVEPLAEGVVLAEEPAEELQGQRADRLVRVRDAEEQDGPPAVANREQLDRAPLGGVPDDLATDEPGEVRGEGARTRGELLGRQELAMVGDAGQERPDVQRPGLG